MTTVSAWPLLVHLVVWSSLLVLAVVTYMYAMSTRRHMTCRSCGERIQTEHDTIDHCPSCGAPLQ